MRFAQLLFLAAALLSGLQVQAQRYSPEFSIEESQKLFEKAEKAYVGQNYERSAKLYDDLMKVEGATHELLFNQLTSLVHTTDTAAIEKAFSRLVQSPFLDCNYLTMCQDFKEIKYRVIFNTWQSALRACSEKEKKYLSENQVQLPEVRTQLLWMKFKDVESDVKVVQKIRYGGFEKISYDSLKEMRAKIYAENFTQLLEFTNKHGWLGKSLVGADGCEAASQVALHATHQPVAQAKLLQTLKTAVDKGDAELRQYAHLFDQVCANYRRPQRYGTLRWKNPDTGKWELYPVEDAAMVNDLRKEAGLPPLNF